MRSVNSSRKSIESISKELPTSRRDKAKAEKWRNSTGNRFKSHEKNQTRRLSSRGKLMPELDDLDQYHYHSSRKSTPRGHSRAKTDQLRKEEERKRRGEKVHGMPGGTMKEIASPASPQLTRWVWYTAIQAISNIVHVIAPAADRITSEKGKIIT
jgi:hypothetical protein